MEASDGWHLHRHDCVGSSLVSHLNIFLFAGAGARRAYPGACIFQNAVLSRGLLSRASSFLARRPPFNASPSQLLFRGHAPSSILFWSLGVVTGAGT